MFAFFEVQGAHNARGLQLPEGGGGYMSLHMRRRIQPTMREASSYQKEEEDTCHYI
jgi:hypothetical protein